MPLHKILSDNFGPILSYNLPVVGTAFLAMPAFILLQGIYVQYFGLELAVVATIFFIARLFDAVTDPVIGYLSDYGRAKGVTRKPWVIGGGLTFLICAYFLYVPPEPVSAAQFLFWFLAFFLAWTCFEIPHNAWGAELTRDYNGRIKIFSMRAFMANVGYVCFFAIPLLPVFETNEFTPATLKYAVVSVGLYLLPTLFYAVRYAPAGEFVPPLRKETNIAILKTLVSNKPFLIFLSAFLFYMFGAWIWYGLSFIVFVNYYGLGDKVAMMYLIGLLAGTISIPLWTRVADRLGKKRTWFLCLILLMLCFFVPFFTFPGEHAFIPLTLMLIGIYVAIAGITIMAPAVLADAVDYGTWRFDADRTGSYFSLYILLTKVSAGIGSAVGLMAAGLLGFNPGTAMEAEDAEFAVHIAFCLLPALMLLISLIFVTKIPITVRHSATIRRRIEKRMQPPVES